MANQAKKTYAYIDGFNLYNGILRRRQPGFKWLNLQDWLNILLKGYDVQKVKFFTAVVSGKYDQNKPARQATYWRALRTLPNVEIIEGNFLIKRVKIHVTQDVDITGKIPEEKGTDVNLAVHLVSDAYKNLFETGVVVSNDSDLAEAVRITTQELGLEVGVINPCRGKFSHNLNRYATFKRRARDGQILTSQFPASLTDGVGVFNRPPDW